MSDSQSWAASALSNILAKALSIFFDNVEDRIEISLWNGVIRLRNLLLKPSAIVALELPVGAIDVSGFLGEVEVVVPWRTLFGSPIQVRVDRLYLVVKGLTDSDAPYDAETEALRAAEALQDQLAAWQMLEDEKQKAGSEPGAAPGKSLLDRIVSFAASKVRVIVSNVHVRVESARELGGEPLVVGATLGSLSLADQDDDGVAEAGSHLATAGRKSEAVGSGSIGCGRARCHS